MPQNCNFPYESYIESAWTLTTCRGTLDLLDNDRQSPIFAQLRPKWQFALKVWKNCKKMKNIPLGFEPAINRLAG